MHTERGLTLIEEEEAKAEELVDEEEQEEVKILTAEEKAELSEKKREMIRSLRI